MAPTTGEGFPSEWMRGFLALAAMAVIAEEETYGYAVVQRLAQAGLGQVKGGTLYPILTRLETSGFVASRWVAGQGGPGRKMLRLTPDGATHLATMADRWTDFTGAVSRVLPDSRDTGRPQEAKDHE